MKKLKKIICTLVTLCLLCNTYIFVAAESGLLVSSALLEGDILTVTGTGEDVTLLVLNHGKTVSELKAADTLAEFKEIVNYADTFNVESPGSYTKTIKIKNFDSKSAYILYVKDKKTEYRKLINNAEDNVIKVYVSASATSGGNGTIEKPFSTIVEARNYVRTLDKLLPIEVILRGGEYRITSAVEINPQDSGTELAPVTYKAQEGERVVLNGSKKLDISKISNVTDGNIRGRVDAKTAKRLVEIDLSQQGIPYEIVNYLSNHGGGYSGKPIGVYLNGEHQNVAKWPNSGYATITDAKTSNGISTFSLKQLDSNRAEKWANAENMYMDGYFGAHWTGEWAKVGNVDAANKTITFAQSTSLGVSNGMKARAVNLLEEIDTPGEWYANPNTMKMYYYPPHKLTEKDTLEIATLTNNFININKGTKFINIEGLEFKQSANSPSVIDEGQFVSNGILVHESSDIEIKNCKFNNIGGSAVFLMADSKNVKIDSCIVNNTGLSGITIKNCGSKVNFTGNFIVSNSYISNASRDSSRNDKAGIHINNSVGVTVVNNVLSNMKNVAIRYSGNLHTIRNNEIYNCVTEASDAGAIYAGRSWAEYGTEVKNNYFHHIGHEGLNSDGASALFLDDLHSGDTFTGNIVDMNNISYSAGMVIAGGRDIAAKDNIFVNSYYSVEGRDRNLNLWPVTEFYTQLFNTFTRATDSSKNITSAANITDADWLPSFVEHFPTIMENFNDIKRSKNNYKQKNTITNNISYNSTHGIGIDTNMSSASTISGNHTPTDPQSAFVDAANGDYRLKKDYKNANNISAGVPDEDFLLSSIGVQSELLITDQEKSFDLMYPFNNDTVSSKNIELKWSPSDFANRYIYEIATDEKFTNIEKTGEVFENAATIDSLSNNTQYYWRVKAINKSKQLGYEVVSDSVFSFKTANSVVVDNIKYDSNQNKISYRLTNNKTETQTIRIFAALKTADGRLVDVELLDEPITSQQTINSEISTAFEKDGTIIEFYAWDMENGLIPLTVTHKFNK